MWKRPNTFKTKQPKKDPVMSLEPNTFTTAKSQPVSVKDKSTLGKNLSFSGDISGNEDVFIYGSFTGNIHLKNNCLHVGRHSKLTSTIYAKSIIVEGTIHGDSYATEQIIVRKTGYVMGNVVAPRITVEDGAVLKGTLDMEEETMAKYFPKDMQSEVNESVVVATALHTPAAKENLGPTLVNNEFHQQQKSDNSQQKQTQSQQSTHAKTESVSQYQTNAKSVVEETVK